MNIGLHLLADEANFGESTIVVTQEEVLESAFESYAAIEQMDSDLDQFFSAEKALVEFGSVLASIEANGLDASVKAFHGKELSTVSEHVMRELGEEETEEARVEALLGDLKPAQENFAAKIAQAVKNIIAKIIAFFQKLFSNNKKLAAKIQECMKDKSAVDADAFAKASVLGYNKDSFMATLDGVKAIAKGIKGTSIVQLEKAAGESGEDKAKAALKDAFGSISNDKAAFKFDEATGKLVPNKEVKREKKSLKDLGFSSSDIASKLGDINEALNAAGKMGDYFKSADKTIATWAKDETKSDLAKAGQKWITSVAGASSLYGKCSVELAMQAIAICKAGKGKKEDPKDDESKGGDEGDKGGEE